MMKRITLALLASAAFATSALAADVLQGFEDNQANYQNWITKFVYVEQMDVWCVRLDGGYSSWGGCVPSSSIPKDKLDALWARLRAAQGR